MDITDRLYVEIQPLEPGPHPHPFHDARFSPDHVYKVLGMYNPSETSECYFILANLQREMWFISQRHLRAFALLDSDEFFLSRARAAALRQSPVGHNGQTKHSIPAVESPPPLNGAGHPGGNECARPTSQKPLGSILQSTSAPPWHRRDVAR